MLRIGEQLCLASSRFGKLNLGSAYCTFSCLQAGVIVYQKSNPEFERIGAKMRPLMVIFNSIGLFWTSGRVLNSLSEKFNISFYSEKLLQGGWSAPDWSASNIVRYNIGMFSIGLLGTLFTASIIFDRGESYQKRAIELFALYQVALNAFLCTHPLSALTMIAQGITAATSLTTHANYLYIGELDELILNSMVVLGALQLGLSVLQNKHVFPAKTVYDLQQIFSPITAFCSTIFSKGSTHNSNIPVYTLIGTIIAFTMLTLLDKGDSNTPLTLKKDFGTLTLNPFRPPQIDIFLKGYVSTEILVHLYTAPYKQESDSRLCFLIAAIKALTLYQISQINWVHIKRTFINPLENQAVQFYDSLGRLFPEGVTSFLKSSAQEVSIDQWMILPADVKLAEGLESLYENMENLFEGSAWKTHHYSFIHEYLVDLKKIPQMLGNLDITQYIIQTTGRIYEKGYGWGILSF